jgi:Domain of unknown function (DUF4357)
MSTFGKSVKIFLSDGTVTGIKFGEIVNHTIQSITCPRPLISALQDSQEYPEAHKPGVYFLFGTGEETNNPTAYIGEAENVFERLKTHVKDAKKDFFNEVIFFVGKDENITKAHVGYIESRLVDIAKSTARGYKIDNTQTPKLKSLPKAEVAAMEEFLTHIKLLLGVLGHKLLEEVEKSPIAKIPQGGNQVVAISSNLELFLSAKGVNARALQTNEGMVVLEGSEAASNVTSSFQPWHSLYRDNLIKNGTLKLDSSGDKYIFQRDELFKSASPAAAIVLGNSANGLTSWKDNSGKTLKDIETERMGA